MFSSKIAILFKDLRQSLDLITMISFIGKMNFKLQQLHQKWWQAIILIWLNTRVYLSNSNNHRTTVIKLIISTTVLLVISLKQSSRHLLQKVMSVLPNIIRTKEGITMSGTDQLKHFWGNIKSNFSQTNTNYFFLTICKRII